MKKLKPDDIVVSVVISSSKNSLARATVIFFGLIETHGWRVMQSKQMHPVFQEEIWIQSPCFKTYDSSGKPKWKENVYIDDKESWELVHRMIYEAYTSEKNKPIAEEATVSILSSDDMPDFGGFLNDSNN